MSELTICYSDSSFSLWVFFICERVIPAWKTIDAFQEKDNGTLYNVDPKLMFWDRTNTVTRSFCEGSSRLRSFEAHIAPTAIVQYPSTVLKLETDMYGKNRGEATNEAT